MNKFQVGEATVILVKGDITDMPVDAIVNAADSSLMGGGGVDGAIHRNGGPRILEECKQLRARDWPKGLPTGKAALTSGGDLKAKRVIHTVGPVWSGGSNGEAGLLAEAYASSLKLAVSAKLKSAAFPSIITGAYGYPISEASSVALNAVKDFLQRVGGLDQVVFVLFSDSDLNVYLETGRKIFSGQFEQS